MLSIHCNRGVHVVNSLQHEISCCQYITTWFMLSRHYNLGVHINTMNHEISWCQYITTWEFMLSRHYNMRFHVVKTLQYEISCCQDITTWEFMINQCTMGVHGVNILHGSSCQFIIPWEFILSIHCNMRFHIVNTLQYEISCCQNITT